MRIFIYIILKTILVGNANDPDPTRNANHQVFFQVRFFISIMELGWGLARLELDPTHCHSY